MRLLASEVLPEWRTNDYPVDGMGVPMGVPHPGVPPEEVPIGVPRGRPPLRAWLSSPPVAAHLVFRLDDADGELEQDPVRDDVQPGDCEDGHDLYF